MKAQRLWGSKIALLEVPDCMAERVVTRVHGTAERSQPSGNAGHV
jgi:hypothetical protein